MNNDENEDEKKLYEWPEFKALVAVILIIAYLFLGGVGNHSDSPDPAETNNEDYLKEVIEMKEHSDEGSWYDN